MKVILIGHGKTGVAFKGAVEMIYGKVDDFLPLTFMPGEGIKDVETKIQNVINDSNEETLVITDLFSGTPYNAASTLALQQKVTDVVAGMSLPMLLEVALNKDKMKVADLVKMLAQDSNSYVRVLSSEVEKEEKEDDF
ncbi:PTS sugar transporter subunit IIA [Lactobacillus corticis]|uniref:PTS sugar transporter subunit IIA n=1 Tax=Lactobacillus corticis TaxID=2201249 RepID=A0A916VII2_9LACO|nr:PTS sugar transporter subunit IIA [Lactobacillus corticis]GFZ27420.1 PTS sugar transporter subunit IIA [Lactobacillus corticis]